MIGDTYDGAMSDELDAQLSSATIAPKSNGIDLIALSMYGGLPHKQSVRVECAQSVSGGQHWSSDR
jgi:hypothetical protein